MRKRILVLMAVALLLPAAARGQPFDVEGFTSIRALDGVDVYVRPGPEHRVVLAQESAREAAKVSVVDGVLSLGRARNGFFSKRFGQKVGLRFNVTVPSLEALDSRAGSEIIVSSINVSSLSINARDGADVIISGTCNSLVVNAASGSDVHARDLSCSNVTARSSGGGDVTVTATASIDASAASGSDIVVFGAPASRETQGWTGGRVVIRD
ncbi:MAG: head GIN domain-containing protein [Pseudomonadota bacterium]